jgi:acetolactate synthase-1/2/3 large subunit
MAIEKARARPAARTKGAQSAPKSAARAAAAHAATHPPAERPGGRVLADALVAQGIDHVFEVPGESYLDVLDGLYDVRDRLKLVTCRFEAAAVTMAEAFGKLNGRPAAAMVTRGPGACHAAIGVHVAMQDSTPLLLFVGQIPFAETDRDSFQEIDYRRMFGAVAKWVTQIDQAERIPEIVAHAVDVATSGRPGPVVIALSEEMQRQRVRVPDIGPAPRAVAHPDPAALVRLQALLGASRRPLAILGGSCWNDEGRAAIRAFLRGNNIPVCVGFRRQALYDGTAQNYAGDLGVGADPALVARVREADLVLAIGTRLGEAVTQGYTLFEHAGTGAGATPIVHVHPDPAEIGRVFRPVLGIACDLNAFAVASATMEPLLVAWNDWTGSLRALREAGRAVPDYAGPLNLAAVMQTLETLLPDDAIITTDAGNFATWAPRFMAFREHQRYIGPTNGAMGYGVPAAIGAKIAHPERTVVCMVGDGGFLMTGQEIATAFHHGIAPIILVFNNQMYGTIRMYQERQFPGRVSGTALTNPDFARFIEAFGGHGEVVSETAQFAPAFLRAVESRKPALIELRTDPDQITTRATIADLRGGATPHPAAKRRTPAKQAPAKQGPSTKRAAKAAPKR